MWKYGEKNLPLEVKLRRRQQGSSLGQRQLTGMSPPQPAQQYQGTAPTSQAQHSALSPKTRSGLSRRHTST